MGGVPARTDPDLPGISVESVSFGYGKGARVLEDVDLTVREGEFLSLLGPSGSGKTTVLRLLAGLESPGAGRVAWKGAAIRGPGIERGVVFQDYSLFPWMRMVNNVAVAIGKANPGGKKGEHRELAEEYLRMVGLGDAIAKYPFELSGGMRQRGAIARAFALGSPVLLMDEPFGALDPVNRAKLQDLLLEVWGSSDPRKTVVFVTHDIEEAIYLGDRVAVLGAPPGRVIAREEVPFDRPRSRRRLLASKEFRELQDRISEKYRTDTFERLESTGIVRDPAEGI
ncbi:MAG: ABC transporter ATP-binding protein [Deltaproteobacteria bacterium]|nr:ABC transporter ATP-binding protein [Deltaproteobacteria bacterium]